MSIKIGINGFGRIGRLALRAAFKNNTVELVCINDMAGNSEALAHLMKYDSVQGIRGQDVTADNNHIIINYHQHLP